MKKTFTTILSAVIILGAFISVPGIADAYTRTSSGSVWNMSRLITQYNGPKYKCEPKSLKCSNNNSKSVKDTNNPNRRNKNIVYECVNGRVCFDKIKKQMKDVKDKLGPGTPLGRAFIPSITSLKVFNSAGDDITYSGCAQPGETVNFVISSEHRTCGTRALITHYDIQFAGQSAHSSKRGDIGGRKVHNMTGGFTFTAPLDSGSHIANIATVNPIAPWQRNKGDGKSRVNYLLANAMSGYYTYELGVYNSFNVCEVDDSTFRSSCFASPLHVKPGESTTFTADTRGGVAPYTYEWEDGSTGTTLTKSYADIGSSRESVTITDSAGTTNTVSCAVTVTENPGFDIDIDTTGDGSGDIFDNAKILNFGTDRLLTNNACTYTWETQGMAYCHIVGAAGSRQSVPLSGSLDLPGGTYTLQCASLATEEISSSQPVRCVLNPDIRET